MGAEPVEDKLRELRTALRELHGTLLESERLVYEKAFGRIASDFYLLQIAAEDPQFAWLRTLSAEMIRLDVLIARDAGADVADISLFGARMRALLLPGEPMSAFQNRYQQAMQEHPSVILAHAAVMRALPVAMREPFFTGDPGVDEQHQGDVRFATHRPGTIVPGHGDQGYGPLALVREMFVPPGSQLPLGEYRNEEVVWWCHEGSIHAGERVDPNRPLVINAGRGYAAVEPNEPGDSPARVIQIFFRPSAVNLEPQVQSAEVSEVEAGAWRQLVGPEGESAPFFVRNSVELHDGRFSVGSTGRLPQQEDWHRYLFVVAGSVEMEDVRIGASGSAVVPSGSSMSFKVEEAATLLVVLVDVTVRVTRAGTIAR